MKKFVISLGVIGILLGAAYLLSQRDEVQTNRTVVLSDGSLVDFVAVTVGTNHFPNPRLGELLSRLPEPVVDKMQGLLGVKTGKVRHRTSETNLVVWIEHRGLAGGANTSASAVLRRPGDRTSGRDQHIGFWLPMGTSNKVHSVSFASWPRREAWIECVILERDHNYEKVEIGSFRFRNPWIVSTPSWSPEPESIVKSAGDLKVTLRHFVTGVGDHKTQRRGADGQKEHVYRAASPNQDAHALVNVDFESPRGTNETWILFNADLSDSVGNKVGAGSRSEMTDTMRFSPILWPNEGAWNLRLHMKRKSGFLPGEMLSFSNIPLPAVGTTNVLNLTNTATGIEAWLAEIRRRPPLDSDTQSWSSRDISRIRLEHEDLGETNQIDLVSMTIQPSGERLKSSGSSWSNDYHEYNLRNLPPSATHLDLRFSVQKARFVDFRVAPNWVTNEFLLRE